MIYNPDGSPMTDEQKSSEVKDNKSAISSIESTMSSASSYYSFGNSLLASIKADRSSMSSDPFVLDKNSKDRSMVASMNGIENIQSSALRSANQMSNSFSSLKERNDILVNGTVGGKIAQSDIARRSAQSSQAEQIRIQNDPQFSMRYSASVSASASIASLSPSSQESMLNSVMNDKRNNSNILDNMNNDPSQHMTPSQLQPFTDPNTIPVQRNKRGNNK